MLFNFLLGNGCHGDGKVHQPLECGLAPRAKHGGNGVDFEWWELDGHFFPPVVVLESELDGLGECV